MKMNGKEWKRLSIKFWKVWPALVRPKGMKRSSDKQNGIIIAIFGMSDSFIGIW